jgi:hypothetical protein
MQRGRRRSPCWPTRQDWTSDLAVEAARSRASSFPYMSSRPGVRRGDLVVQPGCSVTAARR